MRPARLTTVPAGRGAAGRVTGFPPGTAPPGTARPPLVAVAHGSQDPRAAVTVHELLTAVQALSPGLDTRAAFLDHCAPAVGQVLGSLDGQPAVVVPLLLTVAYHAVADIPARLAAAAARSGQRAPLVSAATLGPDPLLLRALERRLAQAGVPRTGAARARTSVVLAAAGSADPAANAAVAALAARWAAERGWRTVVPGYASAAAPTPAEAVRALRAAGHHNVVVASYLLAPGYFADKTRAAALAAGAAAVGAVLGAAPEVAQLVLDRYAAAADELRSPAAAAAPEAGLRRMQLPR